MPRDPAPSSRPVMRASEPRRPRPWMNLLSALLDLGQGKGQLVSHAERQWASATFCGTRHRVILAFFGPDAVAAGEALIECLPEHEFTIPRQLVADAAIVSVEHQTLPELRLTIEAEVLLLEDS